eukprot:GFUD01038029.1.p1 GENE.GFUD01038029.1~~GFUD01038029.1.p1  ORF type:complete len:778 (-),score=179.11 GFUD01038029.1:280-2613(-)
MSENEGMKDVIHTINKLQDVFTSTGISLGLELPQIAVIGGQSAGKSSVLECFVGKDFLPRGNGIVTRRPLVLQLYNNPCEEYAEFLHCEGKFVDFDKVRQEIVDETDRETGSNKGISRKPINLRIYSPHVLNLTLVDLPGLTKVAVGDQPEDIEYQIREMLMEYITHDNTIILAVTPANQDLANSDALKLARFVDKEGNRTIGVITKLDLMDDGTDARDIFENKLLPLKKGYIGVVNRSQRDIDNNKDIRKALASEKAFFLNSPYKSMVNRMGTKYLQQVLNHELSIHIKSKIPEIRSDLLKKSKEVEDALKSLGYTENKEEDMGKMIYILLSKFVEDIQSSINGGNNEVNVHEIKGGALINRSFYNQFNDFFDGALESTEACDREIGLAISNLHGVRNALFIPERAFDKIVENLLGQYRGPMVSCVHHVRGILDDVLEDSLEMLSQYPTLNKEVKRFVSCEIDKREKETNQHLVTHIQAQQSFMNTRHPSFKPVDWNEGSKKEETAEKVHALPADNKEVEEYLYFTGKLRLVLPGSKGSRDAICTITKSEFSFVISPTSFLSSEVKETISLKNVECYSSQSKKLNGRKYILQRMDKRPIYKGEKLLELFSFKEDTDEWIQSFKSAGIFKDLKGSPEATPENSPPTRAKLGGMLNTNSSRLMQRISRRPKNTTDQILNDRGLQDQSKILKKMIENYMKITDTTIRDLVPKYIMFSLVSSTQKYVREELVGDILKGRNTDEAKAELLEASKEHFHQIKELLDIQSATHKAMDVFLSIK